MSLRDDIRMVNTALTGTLDIYREWAKVKGLNYNELIVLYTLDEKKECTPKQISEYWALPKQTVNGILREFEKKGYICVSSGIQDKRERIITYTADGEKFAASILSHLYQMEEAAMESLGAQRCQQLIECNRLYCEALRKELIESKTKNSACEAF